LELAGPRVATILVLRRRRIFNSDLTDLKDNPESFFGGLPGAARIAFFRVRQSLYSPAGSSLIFMLRCKA
jgi:hypothetical protein